MIFAESLSTFHRRKAHFGKNAVIKQLFCTVTIQTIIWPSGLQVLRSVCAILPLYVYVCCRGMTCPVGAKHLMIPVTFSFELKCTLLLNFSLARISSYTYNIYCVTINVCTYILHVWFSSVVYICTCVCMF